jgi:hypothetical protein
MHEKAQLQVLPRLQLFPHQGVSGPHIGCPGVFILLGEEGLGGEERQEGEDEEEGPSHDPP